MNKDLKINKMQISMEDAIFQEELSKNWLEDYQRTILALFIEELNKSVKWSLA